MPKLYFKYGAMGSSKTAQALMCKFNYEQKGFRVMIMKPVLDDRDYEDGDMVVKSRIGLSSKCYTFTLNEDLYRKIIDAGYDKKDCAVIIDECQFCTRKQIEELKEISRKVPVLCYGLLCNFKTELFEGSKRLVEIADSLMEIKSVCRCGRKATVNARFVNGEIQLDGDEVVIGGDDRYEGICYNCYRKLKTEKLAKNSKKPTA